MDSLSFDCAADFYDETRGGLLRGGNFARAIDAHLEPSASVLEVGVGTGLVALPLTDLGHDVIGVDIAPAMLAKARNRIGARVVVADASATPPSRRCASTRRSRRGSCTSWVIERAP